MLEDSDNGKDEIFRRQRTGSWALREVFGQPVPYARMFFGQPSTDLWEDEHNVVHSIHQGVGSKVMPLCLCCSPLGSMERCSSFEAFAAGRKVVGFL